MTEYAFELSLCAALEDSKTGLVGRQIGAGVSAPAGRIADVVLADPGPGMEQRAAITSKSIPVAAIEADVGPGRARYWKRAFDSLDVHPSRAAEIVDRAVSIGFFEAHRRNGRRYIRQTVRYPDWFDHLTAIENKPNLRSPGRLREQLRLDVSLGVFDSVILATESYVTGAHRNRIPNPVGIWRIHEEGRVEVVREPRALQPLRSGIEVLERHPGRTDIEVITPGAKRRARIRIAERVFGGGWRPERLAACRAMTDGSGGTPFCTHFGRIVRPADCGSACPGHHPGTPPAFDRAALREATTPWVADPEGYRRRQTSIDRFE